MEHKREEYGASVHDGVRKQLCGLIDAGGRTVRAQRLVTVITSHDSTVSRGERPMNTGVG